jgi:hypothetical protein
MRAALRALLVALAVLLVASCEDAFSPDGERVLCLTAANCETRLELTPGRFLRAWESLPLERTDTLVRHAIVVVHGSDRDADAYFQTMVDAAIQAGRIEATLVIAPRFMTDEDGPKADEPFWSSDGWKKGDASTTNGPLPRISSYAALDTILARLDVPGRFPKLTDIAVTGHSAGGQVVHRYAAATPMPARLRAGVSVRYVVANPSTWLYLGPERLFGSVFSAPPIASCPDYDDWHYGLQRRNAYASAASASDLKNQLIERDVTVLLGTADTLTAGLDVTCGANLQGRRRSDRGTTLMSYMNALYPGHHHVLVTVPGIGHSSRGMYTSPAALHALFR